MSVRVKICGITHRDDALAAVEAGADALGFVFCEASPRYLTIPAAARIIEIVPPFVARVALFVNAPEAFIHAVIQECGVDTLQLHGDEPPELCRKFRLPVIKGFRIQNEASLAQLPAYQREAWLLDSYVPGKFGGTGHPCNWALARQAARGSARVILAGGLTPASVAEAVRQVRPYAVDVSSGVESSPGRKDRHKMEAFIRAATEAAAQLGQVQENAPASQSICTRAR